MSSRKKHRPGQLRVRQHVGVGARQPHRLPRAQRGDQRRKLLAFDELMVSHAGAQVDQKPSRILRAWQLVVRRLGCPGVVDVSIKRVSRRCFGWRQDLSSGHQLVAIGLEGFDHPRQSIDDDLAVGVGVVESAGRLIAIDIVVDGLRGSAVAPLVRAIGPDNGRIPQVIGRLDTE